MIRLTLSSSSGQFQIGEGVFSGREHRDTQKGVLIPREGGGVGDSKMQPGIVEEHGHEAVLLRH